jgi:hypothetical protein
MSIRVRDRDRGKSSIVAVLELLERGQKVTVGVHEDVGSLPHRGGSGATVAEVAAFAELGTEREAPKAYLRGVIDADRPRLEQGLARAGAVAVKNAARGMDPRQAIDEAVGRVGERAAASVRRRVRQLGLRDTGHLEESIESRLAGDVA